MTDKAVFPGKIIVPCSCGAPSCAATSEMHSYGLSLHDLYRGLAMHAMLCFGNTEGRDPKFISEKSAEIADAMVRQ